ncbi:MAG TPA: hypothetical protein PK397_05125 [Ignavibacteriaceae bacterium]|jgi:hypothetical protein|nr:hypothetical protein [Ignavibacteriaceae bacterium]
MKASKWSIEQGDYSVNQELSDYKSGNYKKRNVTSVVIKAVIFYSIVILATIISLKLI